MGMIRQGFTDFQQELSFFASSFDVNVDTFQFSKTTISHVVKTNPRLLYICRSIENFMGYKMILNYGDQCTALKNSSLPHFSNTMKNSYSFT